VNYLLQPGQVWRSLHTRLLYRVLGIDSLGVKVEDTQAHFPLSPIVYLCPCLFAPPAMQLGEVAVTDDFDAYLNRLADRE
jgi:hypothetical protein